MAAGDRIQYSLTSGKVKEEKEGMTNKALRGMNNLNRLLPTGTVFLFQVLNPVFTNNGHCHTVNKVFTGILLVFYAFTGCFSCFTDSYVGSNGVVHYGIATINGFWPAPAASDPVNVSAYKLRFGDFVHAFWTLIVFAVVSLLNPNTMNCYYPSFVVGQRVLVMLLPPVVGFVASAAFFCFPNKRHGIKSPASRTPAAHDSF